MLLANCLGLLLTGKPAQSLAPSKAAARVLAGMGFFQGVCRRLKIHMVANLFIGKAIMHIIRKGLTPSLRVYSLLQHEEHSQQNHRLTSCKRKPPTLGPNYSTQTPSGAEAVIGLKTTSGMAGRGGFLLCWKISGTRLKQKDEILNTHPVLQEQPIKFKFMSVLEKE